MKKVKSYQLGKSKGGFTGGLKEKAKKISTGMRQVGEKLKSEGGNKSKKGWKPNVSI